MPSLTKREIARVMGIALLVLAVSSIPYVLGYGFAPTGMEFGGLLVDLDDGYSYLAAMRQGLDGGWEYRILFTPEEHPGAYLHTFYLSLGKLSSLLGLSLIQAYHLARLTCGLLLLVTAYVFLSHFLPRGGPRLVAYLLTSLSSGLGWLVLLSGSTTLQGLSPIDFWLMDAYTFFILFTFPHSAMAVTLLLLFLMLALNHLETYSLRALLLAGVVLVPVCVIHPFTILLVDGILGVYWILLSLNRSRFLGREAAAIVMWAFVPVPLLLYYLQVFASNPVLQNWAAQNLLPSPPIGHLLVGYGIVVLLAVAGAAHLVQRRNERALLLVAWAVAALVLLYMPFSLQRRMVEGLHIPLCVLATVGLFAYVLPSAMRFRWIRRYADWRRYESATVRRLLLFTVVVATIPSNLYLVAAYSGSALSADPQLFFREDEVVAIDWMRDGTDRSDAVLASYEIGRYIPARAGNTVFMGHFHETVDVDRKKQLAESFFRRTTSDDFRVDLLSKYRIRLLFHGPAEQQLGGFDPSGVSYLIPVYHHSSVTIYRVNLPSEV